MCNDVLSIYTVMLRRRKVLTKNLKLNPFLLFDLDSFYIVERAEARDSERPTK